MVDVKISNINCCWILLIYLCFDSPFSGMFFAYTHIYPLHAFLSKHSLHKYLLSLSIAMRWAKEFELQNDYFWRL